MTERTLTAVVLNWRTPEYTARAARALIDDGVPADCLVIVDNASGDGSVDRLRQEFGESLLLALDENVGFARGSNRGAQARPADSYLFVNSDAFVHRPGSVRELLGALHDPRVGIAVPRVLNEDLSLQPTVVPISTPLPEFIRASGLSRLLPNGLQPRFGTHWDHGTSRRIQAATGAVVLVRGSAWDQCGGFDESSFIYAEDLELFRHAAELGWDARFVSEAEFIHLGGASCSQRWGDPGRAERIASAEAEMIRKHLGAFRARLTIGLMAAGVGGRAIVHRIRGDRRAAEVQASWWRGYTGRSKASRDRASGD